jgi:phosphoserine phosphatase
VTAAKKQLSVPEVQQIFVRCDAVCFDVDSTVIQEEGIDVLADYCGKGTAVAELTRRAMGGSVLFQDALRMRLELIQPSKQTIEDCIVRRPFRFTPGIQELVAALHSHNKHVYLISGGFRMVHMPRPARWWCNVLTKPHVLACVGFVSWLLVR